MTTDVCPACGYPTLSAALCAFCLPGQVVDVFGSSRPVAVSLESQPARTWPDPVLSPVAS